jgi:hypothetical protein
MNLAASRHQGMRKGRDFSEAAGRGQPLLVFRSYF